MRKNQIPKPQFLIENDLQLEVDKYVVAFLLYRAQSEYPEFMQKKQEALENIGAICIDSDDYFLEQLKGFCWEKISWFNQFVAKNPEPDESRKFLQDETIPDVYKEAFPVLAGRVDIEKYILDVTMKETEDRFVRKVEENFDSLVIDDYSQQTKAQKTKPMKISMGLDGEFEIDFKTLKKTPENSPRTPSVKTESEQSRSL